ncbi:DUF2584 domain-containing protein [Heyndrickxia ginsengihumi]|uniref:DUF2584 domain-containing protein n=1 Tax=Heyndrickxia ginsengihumi TaxID=363870 RepID=UPI00046EF42D|nr:DUF2584 domain-containing protein [Heyndrickxia ginsengihumi]
MGMPIELQTLIITEGKAERLEQNLFVLKQAGYFLYPLDTSLEVRKTIEGESTGIAFIKKLEWEQNTTTIRYELVSLNTPN